MPSLKEITHVEVFWSSSADSFDSSFWQFTTPSLLTEVENSDQVANKCFFQGGLMHLAPLRVRSWPHQEHSFKIAWSAGCQTKGSVPCDTAASQFPSHRVSQARDWSRLAKGRDEFPPETGLHHEQWCWTRRRVKMSDSGGETLSPSPWQQHMSRMQVSGKWSWKHSSLSRAKLFLCAKGGIVELMLQHIVISIFPCPRSFAQHSTCHYRQPSGDSGPETRAAGLTQLSWDSQQDSTICEWLCLWTCQISWVWQKGQITDVSN